MGRIGWFGVAALAAASTIGVAIYSTMLAVNMCEVEARGAVERADPLDRSPPPAVAAVVAREVGLRNLADELTTVLIDRFACTKGANDWLIVRPALSWKIQRSFSDSQRVALFASTVDTGAGQLGIAAGARKFYARSSTELDEASITCLVRKARGQPRGRWASCGNEAFPAVLIPPVY